MIGKIENEMNFVFSENDFYANFSLDVSLLQMAPRKLATKRANQTITREGSSTSPLANFVVDEQLRAPTPF